MVFLLICLVACLAVGIYVISIAAELPDITAEDLVQAQTSFVYDQMGCLLYTSIMDISINMGPTLNAIRRCVPVRIWRAYGNICSMVPSP